jgi:hypothetical protein
MTKIIKPRKSKLITSAEYKNITLKNEEVMAVLGSVLESKRFPLSPDWLLCINERKDRAYRLIFKDYMLLPIANLKRLGKKGRVVSDSFLMSDIIVKTKYVGTTLWTSFIVLKIPLEQLSDSYIEKELRNRGIHGNCIGLTDWLTENITWAVRSS